MEDKNTDYLDLLENVNPALRKKGWMITPYMIGRDTGRIKKALNQNNDDELENVFIFYSLDPLYRAFYLARNDYLNNLDNINDLIKSATFEFLKGQYESSILIFTHLLERYFRLKFAIQPGNTCNLTTIKSKLAESQKKYSGDFKERYHLYIDAVIGILEDHLLKSGIESASDVFEAFNRHWIFHGFGDFTNVKNICRYILLFDIFCEIESLEQNCYSIDGRSFLLIPDGDAVVMALRKYLEHLQNEIFSLKYQLENLLLKRTDRPYQKHAGVIRLFKGYF